MSTPLLFKMDTVGAFIDALKTYQDSLRPILYSDKAKQVVIRCCKKYVPQCKRLDYCSTTRAITIAIITSTL